MTLYVKQQLSNICNSIVDKKSVAYKKKRVVTDENLRLSRIKSFF